MREAISFLFDVFADRLKLKTEIYERYVYYTLAMSLGALGFSVAVSIERIFQFNIIFLWCAMLCWLYSILQGLRALLEMRNEIDADIEIAKTLGKAKIADPNNDPEEAELKKLIDALDNVLKRRWALHGSRVIVMLIGFGLFIVWYIFKSFLNSSHNSYYLASIFSN